MFTQKLSSNGYTADVFSGYYGEQIYISNPEGVQIYAHKFTGDAQEILDRVAKEDMGSLKTSDFDKNVINQAVTTLSGQAVLMGEENGKKQLRAVLKAAIELKTNRSINFDREFGILKFKSSASNKTRIVTAHGCSNECQCKGAISYHSALFQLIAECLEIEKSGKVIKFPARVFTSVRAELKQAA